MEGASEPHDEAMHALDLELLKLCPTPCDPMDCSPPGSSLYYFLQARMLEWVAMSFSRESPFLTQGLNPWSPALQADYLWTELPGKRTKGWTQRNEAQQK